MFKDTLEKLRLTRDELQLIQQSFSDEIALGLKGQSSCLGCFNTHVYLPIVHDASHFLAIDLGGTNLRVAFCERLDNRVDVISFRKEMVPVKLMSGEVSPLFDFVVTVVNDCMGDFFITDTVKVGFTFSFRVDQESKKDAIIKQWNKGYKLKVDFDPVSELTDAFIRAGLTHLSIDCLLNDTTATLLANYFVYPQCDIGLILGTGTNMCLAVPKRLLGTDLFSADQEKLIFNLESGNFNVNLPRLAIDELLDEGSLNPGVQLQEKMVSGLYLGELASLLCLDYFDEKDYISEWKKDDFLSSGLVGQFQSADNHDISTHFKQLLGIDLNQDDVDIIKSICILVTKRSAQIAAASIAGAIWYLDPKARDQHVIGIDGSLYTDHPHYQDYFEEAVFDLLPEFIPVLRFSSVEQASLVGTALAIE